jgi:hypothetical protein
MGRSNDDGAAAIPATPFLSLFWTLGAKRACVRDQPGTITATIFMFEILFLALAIVALLRLPKDVRRMRQRKRSALPSRPEYQISGHAGGHHTGEADL